MVTFTLSGFPFRGTSEPTPTPPPTLPPQRERERDYLNTYLEYNIELLLCFDFETLHWNSARTIISYSQKYRGSKPLELTHFSEHTHLAVFIVQELCESRGGRPGLSVLTSLLASVDVKIY